MRRLLLSLAVLLFPLCAPAQYWKITEGPPASVTAMIVNYKGVLYAATENAGVYVNSDNGITWERMVKGLPDDGFDRVVSSLVEGANGDLFLSLRKPNFLQTDDGVYRLRAGSDTWEWVYSGVPNTRIVNVDARPLPNGETRLISAVYDGTATQKFYLSNNSGTTWTEIPTPGVSMVGILEVGCSDISNNLYCLVKYNKGLFRSLDDGASWARIDAGGSGETDDNFKTFRVAPNGWLYVGRNALETSTHTKNAVVLRSKNDGDSWEYLTEGWPEPQPEIRTLNRISGIAFGPDGLVVATTSRSGTMVSTNNGDSWTVEVSGLPSSGSADALTGDGKGFFAIAPPGDFIHIHGNLTSIEELPSVFLETTAQPNPTTNTVVIQARLRSAQDITLKLLDMAGREVIPAYVTPATSGDYRVALETSALPVGAYTYVMQSGAFVQSGIVHVIR